MNPPSRKTIIELSRYSPLIHNSLEYWRIGEISFEEALMVIVYVQAEIIKENESILIKHLEMRDNLIIRSEP